MAKKAKKAVAKTAKKPGTAVAVHKATPPAAPQNFYEMLHSLATDPRVNVANVQAILEMKYREEDRAKEAEFNERMAKVQEAMEPIRADMESAKPKNKYASHVKLDNAIRPIYARHGFAVSYDNDECPHPLTVRVVAYVTCAGHKRRYFIDIPADGKGPSGGDVMSRTHAVGSANTYGKGILLRNIFNLVVDKTSDDDGGAAGGNMGEPTTATKAQVKRIQELMEDTDSPVSRVLNYASGLAKKQIETLQDIPANLAPQIIKEMEGVKAQAKK